MVHLGYLNSHGSEPMLLPWLSDDPVWRGRGWAPSRVSIGNPPRELISSVRLTSLGMQIVRSINRILMTGGWVEVSWVSTKRRSVNHKRASALKFSARTPHVVT